MMMKKGLIRIKHAILFPLGTALCLLLVTSFFGAYWILQHHFDSMVRSHLQGAHDLFNGMLDKDAEHLHSLLDLYKDNKELQSPYVAKDRT